MRSNAGIGCNEIDFCNTPRGKKRMLQQRKPERKDGSRPKPFSPR
ncbi:MAG: hypothetical protein V4689_05205 [Verrucomicrobiota bacterium]